MSTNPRAIFFAGWWGAKEVSLKIFRPCEASAHGAPIVKVCRSPHYESFSFATDKFADCICSSTSGAEASTKAARAKNVEVSMHNSYGKTPGKMAVECHMEAINQDSDRKLQLLAKNRSIQFSSFVLKHDISSNYKQIYGRLFTT